MARLVITRPVSGEALACALTAAAANLTDQTDIVLASTGSTHLELPSGDVLHTTPAICKYFALAGSNSLLASSPQLAFIEDVVEVDVAALQGVIVDLAARLARQKYLTGELPTLADLVTFARFYPNPPEDASVLRWFSELGATKLVTTVLDALGLPSISPARVQGSSDLAWAPEIPNGHTAFTWGLERPVARVSNKPQRTQQKVQNANKPALPAAVPDSEEDTGRHVTAADIKTSFATPVVETFPSPRLPIKGARNILITSALPYVNNVPHLGNIIGCVLSADVYARFCRLRGHNAIYVCGTDEYGTATEIKALEAGTTPQKICDKYHAVHKAVYEWFDCQFDEFGRTTTKHQTIIAQDIFNKCDANGFITHGQMDQLWCEGFGGGKFLADRFVCGECPRCHYEDANGDQCDACGVVLNAVELIHPTCKMDKAQPVTIRPSAHMFLDLPKLTPQLTAWIEQSEVKGNWSKNSKDTTHDWLNMGLKERCITRDLDWGTPVPKDGFEKKVFYVWFDAPIGYLSITACYTEQWEQWWKNPDNVELVQFMGKDNVPFHTVIFPSSLLATKDNYTMLHHINTTEYLNYEGGKFSKSKGVGVFGDDAMNTGVPSSVWRYYLLANRPEQSDTVFTWKDFQAKNNSELLNNLGNFVNRATRFAVANFDGTVPDYSQLTDVDATFIQRVHDLTAQYVDALENYHIKKGLQTAMQISKRGNQYIQDTQPFALVKGGPADKQRAGTVLGLALNLVYHLALLLEPYMPAVSKDLSGQLNAPLATTGLKDTASFVFRLSAGHKLGTPALLFTKIEDARIEELAARFAEKAAKDSSVPLPLQLVVGRVLEVTPLSDKLYVLQIDLGEADPRQVVSGLVPFYARDELLGKQIVVLSNAKSAKLAGTKSNGMVMTGEKDGVMGLLTIDQEVPPGTRLLPEGGSVKPVKNFDIRKDLASIELTTGEGGTAYYAGMQLKALGNPVYAERGVAAGGVLR